MLEIATVILGTTIGLLIVMGLKFSKVKIKTQEYLNQKRRRK